MTDTYSSMQRLTLDKYDQLTRTLTDDLPVVLMLGNSQVAWDGADQNAQSTIANLVGPCVMVNGARGAYNSEGYQDVLHQVLSTLDSHAIRSDLIYLDISGNDTVLSSCPTGQHIPLDTCVQNHEAMFRELDSVHASLGRSATLIVANGSPLDLGKKKGPVGHGRRRGASNDNTARYANGVYRWALDKRSQVDASVTSGEKVVGITRVVPANTWDAIVQRSRSDAGSSLADFTSDGLHMKGKAWDALDSELRRFPELSEMNDTKTHDGIETGSQRASYLIRLQDSIPNFAVWQYCKKQCPDSVSKRRDMFESKGGRGSLGSKLRGLAGTAPLLKWVATTDEQPHTEIPKLLSEYGFGEQDDVRSTD